MVEDVKVPGENINDIALHLHEKYNIILPGNAQFLISTNCHRIASSIILNTH
jgi:hypothetical protein